MIKLSVLKNRLSGILSVVGISTIPEEIQLLVFAQNINRTFKLKHYQLSKKNQIQPFAYKSN
jgi:hypothetical protein